MQTSDEEGSDLGAAHRTRETVPVADGVYNLDTRMVIQNKEQKAVRSSHQPDLVTNDDGSVDLWDR